MANPTGKGGFGERKQQINRKGRPKDFDSLRTLAQQIAHRKIVQEDGTVITVTESILTQWAESKDARLQMQFIEVAYGKVPNEMLVGGKEGSAPIETRVTHDIDATAATSIFDILAAAGVFESAAGDTETD